MGSATTPPRADSSEPSPLTWRHATAAVWEGATRTSLFTAMGLLLLAIAQLGFLCLVVTPERIARMDPGVLMSGPHDYDVQATVAAQQLARLPQPETGVVFVTTSSGRHAITGEETLSEQLSALAGEPVRFHLIASGRQSVWQTVQILDQLPTDFRGVVLITVGPSRLGTGRDALAREVRWPRLGLDSGWLREEIELAGLAPTRNAGVYFLDQGRFFATRRRAFVRNALFGRPTYRIHRFNFPGRASEVRWQALLPEFDQRMDRALGEEGERDLAVLERTVTRLRERADVSVALVESTRHPRIIEMYGARYPHYRRRVQAAADRAGVPMWDLDREAGLVAADFFDWTHLGSRESRRRYQSVLAQRAAELLRSPGAAPEG